MSHHYSSELSQIVAADPDAIWDAIATGPGVDSWLMGRNEFVPPATDGTGGVLRMAMGDYQPVSDITAWQPPNHLAYSSRPEPDGSFIAYEFLVEGRENSTSVVRVLVSGFLPQDDWEDEFEAMTLGGAMYFATLGAYAEHFAGRRGEPVVAFSPPVSDWDAVWRSVYDTLALGETPKIGDTASVTVGGATTDAEVYFVNAHTLGLRTESMLLRILKGFNGTLMVMHSAFEPVGPATFEAWTAWLTQAVTRANAPVVEGARS